MSVFHEEETGLRTSSTGAGFGRLASTCGAAQLTCASSTPRLSDTESTRQAPMSMFDRDTSKGSDGEADDSCHGHPEGGGRRALFGSTDTQQEHGPAQAGDRSPEPTPWSLLGRKAQAAQRKSHAELQREMVDLFNQSRLEGTVVRTKLGPQGSFKVTADTPPGSFSNKKDNWKCPDETWCPVEKPKPRALPADPKVDVYTQQLDPAAAAAVILW